MADRQGPYLHPWLPSPSFPLPLITAPPPSLHHCPSHSPSSLPLPLPLITAPPPSLHTPTTLHCMQAKARFSQVLRSLLLPASPPSPPLHTPTWLHCMQAVTRLSQVLRPPLLTGITWSRVSSTRPPPRTPQYCRQCTGEGGGQGELRCSMYVTCLLHGT